MTRGVRKYLVSSVVLVALIAVAGCSHYLMAEREPWRHDAEIACLNSGAVQESAARVRIASIDGPGVCGADYPLRVSALGERSPLGYTDEPVRPPGAIPDAALPQRWPVVQSTALPPLQQGAPQTGAPQYGQPKYSQPQYNASRPVPPPAGQPPPGAPLSLYPPGVEPPEPDDADLPGGPPNPYYGAPVTTPGAARIGRSAAPAYPPRPQPAPRGAEQQPPPGDERVPLGPPTAPLPVGPVEVQPAATLACPIVSALDQWISGAVQPAALKWFRLPVVEIKQISAYSCRGMNGNPNAHISEHAFGNALDVAEFDLADGRKVSVQHGWRGTPEEQGFLRDVQAAACQEFTTVLAPGANVYHYNHIHVDLMRRSSGRRICEPSAVPGEFVAERARARYAQRDPAVTGSVKSKSFWHPFGYSGEDNDSLPLAVPGDD
jgi:Extensin-like protein C-terminus